MPGKKCRQFSFNCAAWWRGREVICKLQYTDQLDDFVFTRFGIGGGVKIDPRKFSLDKLFEKKMVN